MKKKNYSIKNIYITEDIDKTRVEEYYCCKLCKSKFRFEKNFDIHFKQFHQDSSSCIFFRVCYQ